jgi:hypothetical protein
MKKAHFMNAPPATWNSKGWSRCVTI